MIGVLSGFFVVWAIILVGMFVGRRNILGDNARSVLSSLTFFVASPALLFETLSKAKLHEVFAAPLLVILLRVIQGLALGGEYGGAAIYVAEHSPPDKRGRYTGWIQAAASAGFLLSILVILGCKSALSTAEWEAWGWRLPFIGSVVLLAISLWCAPLAGCVVYEVPTTPSPGVFDRAWSAALGGMQDAGVQVTSADPTTGLIRGTKDGIDATAIVARQADGSVRVQFDAKGPTQRDPSDLAESYITEIEHQQEAGLAQLATSWTSTYELLHSAPTFA